jgi:hypothetical protein
LDIPANITLGLVPLLPDLYIQLSQDVFLDMDPGETSLVTLTVTLNGEIPPDGTPLVDVEGWANGMAIGGVRKLFRPPLCCTAWASLPSLGEVPSIHIS